MYLNLTSLHFKGLTDCCTVSQPVIDANLFMPESVNIQCLCKCVWHAVVSW